MLQHLAVELIFEDERVENHNIPLPRTESVYLFEKVELFQKRPYLVSCVERNYYKTFIPGLMTLKFIAGKIEISQAGTVVLPETEYNDNTPVKFFVFYRFDNPKLLNDAAEAANDYLLADKSIGIYLKYIENDLSMKEKYFRTTLCEWKQTLRRTLRGSYFYDDPKSFCLVEVKVKLGILYDDEEMVGTKDELPIPIRPFMHFEVRNLFKGQDIRTNVHFEPLAPSFKQKLTVVGQSAIESLKKEISKHHKDWSSSESSLIAPVLPVWQYSGSGKSKIGHELTNQVPGVVLTYEKDQKHTGYPASNNLSSKFTELLRSFGADGLSNQMHSVAKENSATSAILNFIAAYLYTYCQELIDVTVKVMESGTSVEEALKIAYRESGPRIPSNHTEWVDDYEFKHESLAKMFEHCYSKVETPHPGTNKQIVDFIELLLTDPAKVLSMKKSNADESEKAKLFKVACEGLLSQLQSFPLVFVFDGAYKLTEKRYGAPDFCFAYVYGLEVLKRALSHLNPGTPIFFLTLGLSKDLIAPLASKVAPVARPNRTYWPGPFLLKENIDIFKHEEGMSYLDFVPCYESLKNPFVFKLLTSMGSPLWSSTPFNCASKFAFNRIHDDTLAAVMIRTGLPFETNTDEFVREKMGTLTELNFGGDIKSITYPSQPIFGMASRPILSKTSYQNGIGVFIALRTLVKRQVARPTAFLTCLFAIDRSTNAAREAKKMSEYLKSFVDMVLAQPKLARLWRKREFLLADDVPLLNSSGIGLLPSIEEKIDGYIEQIFKYRALMPELILALPLKDIAFIRDHFEEEDYANYRGMASELPQNDNRVVRVADFLVTLYGKEIEAYLQLLPQSTLEGLVNASHFQNLSRAGLDGKGCVIDADLLKLGLTRQCAFGLPAEYSGITGIIPVCLPSKNGTPVYTFIAIKVKQKNESIDFDDALGMQAKLHFVHCEHAANEAVDDRHVCSTAEDLHEIYDNQIALVFSFAKTGKGTSVNNGLAMNLNQESVELSLEEALNELYDPEGFEAFKATDQGKIVCKDIRQKITKSDINYGPRIEHKLEVNAAISILSCLWDDDKNFTPSAPKKTKIEQESNRQRIFCIASTGFDTFQRFYNYSCDRELAESLFDE